MGCSQPYLVTRWESPLVGVDLALQTRGTMESLQSVALVSQQVAPPLIGLVNWPLAWGEQWRQEGLLFTTG